MNVYEIVTNKLLEELAKGKIPWRRPWRTEGEAINYITRKPYQGINRLLLQGGEYLSFKQIQDKGGKIKKGSKAQIVVFWKWLEKQDDETGKTEKIPFLRYYNVFSIHDCEGIESKLPPIERKDINPIEEAEKVFNEYVNRENITLQHQNINRAYYSPDQDLINLPNLNQYDESEEYYSTAFHEAAHSTGHETRLKRLTKTAAFGSQTYSKEELTAEIAAAYLCESVGIDTNKTLHNSAGYIQGWSSKLKSDPKMAVMAAGAAEKAARYILNETNQPEVEHE